MLRAPHCGGGNVLVNAWDKPDMMRIKMLLRSPKRLVKSAKRGAPVAGNETAGMQSGSLVAYFLHQRKTHQRLYATEVNAATLGHIFIVKRNCEKWCGSGARQQGG